MRGPAVNPLPFTEVQLTSVVRHYRCPRDWSWKHRLTDFDLWLVLAGSGRLQVNGKERVLIAATATLLKPGEEVAGDHDPRDPLEVIALHFTPRVPRSRAAALGAWAEKLTHVPLRPAARFRELGEQLASESLTGDPLSAQVAPLLALGLLAAVWRLAHGGGAAEGDDRVEELLRVIQREPWREWVLEDMARQAGMGTTRLNTRVRELTGYPPARWVIRCRLEHACVLLRETEMKLAPIAEACGYRDVYFFVRQFRQAMGRPPGEWRAAEKAKRDTHAKLRALFAV